MTLTRQASLWGSQGRHPCVPRAAASHRSARRPASRPTEYKICRTHFVAADFQMADGQLHRFCQQCSRIQVG